MRVLLAGATGFIGRHIGRALLEAGHEVVGCTRNRHAAFRDHPGLGWIHADFAADRTANAWRPRLTGFDAVVNAAGILREDTARSFEAIHFEGPRALYEACAEKGVRRVIHISALGCEHNPRPYAETKARLDRHLATLDLDWTVLRPSLVYGEDSPSSRLFRFLARLPVIPVVADGGQWLQPIHVDDLARAVVRLLEDGAAHREVLELGGPSPTTYRDFLAELRASLNRRSARFLPVPLALARLGARASDLVGVGPVGMDTLNMLVDGNVTAANRAPALLGREPMGIRQFAAGTSPRRALVFLYDGACAICVTESERLRRWNRGRDNLRFIDISAEGFDPVPYGRSLEELMGRVHAIRPDGAILVGMEAIRAAYAEVGLGWVLAPTGWPGMRPLFDAAYLWFARNRYSISKLVCRDDNRCGI
jgi:uncharacterized protein YbjT (DUF2867 family)/predicted DCC family thiol-disulfide oxidoreductase YuxK